MSGFNGAADLSPRKERDRSTASDAADASMGPQT